MSEEKIKLKKINVKGIIILMISITVISIIVLYLLSERVEPLRQVASPTDDFKFVIKPGCKTGAKSLENIIDKKYKATFTCLGEIENLNIDEYLKTSLSPYRTYLLPNDNVLFYIMKKAVIYNPETNKSIVLTDNIDKTASLNRINEIPSNMKDKYFISHYIIFDSTKNKFYKLSKDRINLYNKFIKQRKNFKKNSSLITNFDNNTSLYGSECEEFEFDNLMNGCKEIWLEDFTNLKRYKPVKLPVRKNQFEAVKLKNENILLIGGVSHKKTISNQFNQQTVINKTFSTIELYNPKKATLFSVGNINISPYRLRSLFLKDGNLLIMSDFNLEVIDTKTYKTINHFNLSTYKQGVGTSLLNDGKVLFLGEYGSIYDPKSNKLYNFSNVLTHRFNAKILTLKNGQVLIFGGDLDPSLSVFFYKKDEYIYYNTAELFTIENINNK